MTPSTETVKAVSAETLRSISTPDHVESRLGTLEFDDGAPTDATAELLYDHLDFVRGVEAFLSAFPGASMAAMRKGFQSIGIEDNSLLIYSPLADSASLYLTANCDTPYFAGFVDLTDGPMVLDVPALAAPSGILGTIDDMWWGWVTDFGVPGPDRSEGGRYLLVGPDYKGLLPDSGFHVSRARTTRVFILGRAFMVDNNASLAVDTVRSGLRISKYVPGTQGTAIATFLAGKAPLAPLPTPTETHFTEGTGLPINTIPANDFTYWELINGLVQQEPAGAADPEIMGLLASVGIVKGKPFKPDKRMRKILEDAVVVGNATARTISFAPRPAEGFAYYPDSAWLNPLFVGGYDFLDPPPRSPQRALSTAPATARASSTPASPGSTHTPASPPRCACASPAWAPNTSSRCATQAGSSSTADATTGSPSRPTSPRADSGR